jgi:hypothetical protein
MTHAKRHFERDPLHTDDPATGWRRLAAAVLIEAMRRAHKLKDLEAVDFLELEALQGGWRDLAGVEGVKLFDFLAAGGPKVPTYHPAAYNPKAQNDTG